MIVTILPVLSIEISSSEKTWQKWKFREGESTIMGYIAATWRFKIQISNLAVAFWQDELKSESWFTKSVILISNKYKSQFSSLNMTHKKQHSTMYN
jgi:hypothetical protein